MDIRVGVGHLLDYTNDQSTRAVFGCQHFPSHRKMCCRTKQPIDNHPVSNSTKRFRGVGFGAPAGAVVTYTGVIGT